MIRPILNKTPDELFNGRKSNIMHLRVFGCKCYMHNNEKDALRKFDPRSNEEIFFGYTSHSKAYKVFNKRTLCVEESVHVFFDETNPLVENDAQDDDFELDVARKNLLLTHEEGEYLKDGSRPGAVSLEGGQGLNQIGESTAEPSLKRNQPNTPKTGSRIGSGTGSRTGSGTGSRTALEPVSPSIQARIESASVDPLTPRPWKQQNSLPPDQILSNLNTGVQSRSKLKNFWSFYAFLSNIQPKNVNEALADSDWVITMQEELHQL